LRITAMCRDVVRHPCGGNDAAALAPAAQRLEL
jgi:hypothetical protein